MYRSGKSNETRKLYYSGKQKAFTIKTQMVADDDHHMLAISVSVPGAMHDKKLSDDQGGTGYVIIALVTLIFSSVQNKHLLSSWIGY